MPIPTKNILDLADGDEGSYFANNMNQNNNNFSLGGPQKRTLTQSREISMYVFVMFLRYGKRDIKFLKKKKEKNDRPQTINNNKGSSSSSKHFTLLQNV